jgi:hypothetical protein
MKSTEFQFNEALEVLDKVGKRQQFDERIRSGMPIESKLNLAQTLIEEAGFDSAHQVQKLDTFKEQQYKAAIAGGMSEAEARAMSDLCGAQRR